MSRVPREGRPQKRAKKKNVSTQKAKKKKKTTLERRVASVTRGSHVSRVFSPLSAFSLCHEKKTRQRKRRLLLRVYVQLRFYETCVYVIENKKKNRETFLYFRTRGKSQHKKYDLSVGVGLRLSRLRVSRPRERCALRRSVRRRRRGEEEDDTGCTTPARGVVDAREEVHRPNPFCFTK